MSHHFDWPRESQDISDVHCFAGPSDDDGPRTVIGMNVSPQFFKPNDMTPTPRRRQWPKSGPTSASLAI